MAETDEKNGNGGEGGKKDRGLFASARKLARAAVTRAIERLTGMPLSGDPWASRPMLDAPGAPVAKAAPAPMAARPATAPAAPAPKPAPAPVAAKAAPAPAAAKPAPLPVKPAPVATRPAPAPARTPAPAAKPAPAIVPTKATAAPLAAKPGGVPAPAPAAAPPTPVPRAAPAVVTTAPFPQEPLGILDLEETPETYGIDEVAVIARDPRQLFVHWEVTPGAWAHARAALGGAEGKLTLRLFVTARNPDDSFYDFIHDEPLPWDHGRRYVPAPAKDARVSAAVGVLTADGRFAGMAFAPPTNVPSGAVAADGATEWMDVAPAGPPGEVAVPPRVRAVGSAAEVAAAIAATGGRQGGRFRLGAVGSAGEGRRLPSGLYAAGEDGEDGGDLETEGPGGDATSPVRRRPSSPSRSQGSVPR